MARQRYYPLKGIGDIHEYTLSNDIQDGLLEYFDWALLEIGNYFNVTYGELAPNGNDYSRLRLSDNPSYSDGQVWEGFRKNWVWQSGITYTPEPLVGDDNDHPGVSGVYVDGDFYPNNTSSDYAHYIDHYNGRVIFDSPIPTGSEVSLEYSYKWINVMYANNVPWVREIQEKTLEPNASFLQREKGDWNIPPEARIQLPAIAIEIVPKRTFKGYQLGGGQWVYTDVIFHCIAEDEITRNKLLDIVSLQSDKNIILFDSNDINNNNDYPLDYRGVPTSGALMYPELMQEYGNCLLRLTKATVQEVVSIGSDVFAGTVRFTTELINDKI